MPASKKPSPGRKSDKVWRDALLRAVNRAMENGGSKYLEGIAKRCVEKAAAGDMQAIKEIGDRLDGRPAQAIEHSGEMTVNHEDWLDRLPMNGARNGERAGTDTGQNPTRH